MSQKYAFDPVVSIVLSAIVGCMYLFQVFHMVFCSREDKGLFRWLDQVLKNVQQHS